MTDMTAASLIEKYVDPEMEMATRGHAESLTPAQVVAQVRQIEEVIKTVFREDVHFGKIPGCGPKPTLLKPGAEKLGLLFRLAPRVDIREEDLGEHHRAYHVTVTLTHAPSGLVMGEGVGCCSTMESKYRYRWDDTGQPVPSAYWDSRDPALLGGPSFTAKKKGGRWVICRKVETDDPADSWNTVLKIGKKRAMVDAVLSATAASDLFTQDIEDMPGLHRAEPQQPAPQQPAPQQHRTIREEEIPRPQEVPRENPARAGKKISEGQWKRLYALSMEAQDKGRGPQQVKAMLMEWFGDDNPKHLRAGDEYREVCDWTQTGKLPSWVL